MTKVETLKSAVVPKEIHVGTKESDVYKNKELIMIFNSADKNGDKVIDESEMLRLKGPSLVIEKEDNSKQRFIGSYSGHSGLYPSSGSVEGKIIKSSEYEIYPGLTREELSGENSKFIPAFSDLDNNPCDGVIQKEEITGYHEYCMRREQLEKTINDNKEISDNNLIKSVVGTIGGGFLGLICYPTIQGVSERIIHKKYTPEKYAILSLKEIKEREIRRASDFKKILLWPEIVKKAPKGLRNIVNNKYSGLLTIGGMALGAVIGSHIAQKMRKKEKPLDEFNDLKQLDVQYQHIYNNKNRVLGVSQ